MKKWLVLLLAFLFMVHLARTQSTNEASGLITNSTTSTVLTYSATTNNPELAPPPFTTELSRTFAAPNIEPLEPKANEVRMGNVRASGIAVEVAKTGNPLSLVNPFNPPTNSSPEDNVVRDPFDGRVKGLSVFTIRF